VSKTTFQPLLKFGALKIVKNEIELRKLWPLKVERVKNSKNKPPNVTKVDSQTPTKFLICCFVVIKVHVDYNHCIDHFQMKKFT
jgi:hypothetical protein